jgi:hypothetical protein
LQEAEAKIGAMNASEIRSLLKDLCVEIPSAAEWIHHHVVDEGGGARPKTVDESSELSSSQENG